MEEKQIEQNLAKGPPGCVVRKSRDSLWMFGVRGDPQGVAVIGVGVETGHVLSDVLSEHGLFEMDVSPDGYRDNRKLKPRRLKISAPDLPFRMMNDVGRMMNSMSPEVRLPWSRMFIANDVCYKPLIPEGSHIEYYRPVSVLPTSRD
jgi:hypothetical protein